MTSPLALDPALLTPFLEAAIMRLGELGQPGVDAFNELMASRGDSPEFDAGIDLLDRWIGDEPADRRPLDLELPPIEGADCDETRDAK